MGGGRGVFRKKACGENHLKNANSEKKEKDHFKGGRLGGLTEICTIYTPNLFASCLNYVLFKVMYSWCGGEMINY